MNTFLFRFCSIVLNNFRCRNDICDRSVFGGIIVVPAEDYFQVLLVLPTRRQKLNEGGDCKPSSMFL